MIKSNIINTAFIPEPHEDECVMTVGFIGQSHGGLVTATYASGRVCQWENIPFEEFLALNTDGPVSTALFLWKRVGRHPVADYFPRR